MLRPPPPTSCKPRIRRPPQRPPKNPVADFETRAIHNGQEPDPATGPVTAPIYQTSTYVQEAVGEHGGYGYSRAGTWSCG
jgi:Cys/Met metabolism PLP-dependent enzyme